MELDKLIKIEPIDLTQIIVTILVLGIVIFAFKSQLNSFFLSLKDRPITVKMSAAETTIQLDAPVTPETLLQAVANPEGSRENLEDWEQAVAYIENIEDFAKLGFGDLYEKLSALGPNEPAVINFAVNDSSRFYFKDESMLKYLSIASEKVRYLAFYEARKFVGVIRIQQVIAGLASNSYEFKSFGEKIKTSAWKQFPGLISRDSSLSAAPSIKQLRDHLLEGNLSEVPFVQNDLLVGFLNYKSISNELYAQATAN